jgi:hypothetical protein
MKCYYHPEKDAVAICKECNKPLCEECAHEINGKIYCEECISKIEEKSKRREERPGRNEGLRSRFPAILLLTIIIVAVVLITIFTVFVIPGRRNILPFEGKEYSVTGEFSRPFNQENYLRIDANIGAEDIYIHSTNSFLYKVEGRGDIPEVDYNNNTLTITSEDINKPSLFGGKFLYPFPENLTKRLDLYINSSVKLDIVMKVGTGTVTIKDTDINFGDVSIEEGVGNVTVDNCKIESLTINSGIGNVNISNIENTEKMRIKGGVGNFNIDISKVKTSSSVIIQNGVGSSLITVSDESAVRAEIEALSIKTDGFTKEGSFYINKKYVVGFEDIYIKVSSAGKVEIKEVNYERP